MSRLQNRHKIQKAFRTFSLDAKVIKFNENRCQNFSICSLPNFKHKKICIKKMQIYQIICGILEFVSQANLENIISNRITAGRTIFSNI